MTSRHLFHLAASTLLNFCCKVPTRVSPNLHLLLLVLRSQQWVSIYLNTVGINFSSVSINSRATPSTKSYKPLLLRQLPITFRFGLISLAGLPPFLLMMVLNSVATSVTGVLLIILFMNFLLRTIQKVTASLRLLSKTLNISCPSASLLVKIVTKQSMSGVMYQDPIVTVRHSYYLVDVSILPFPLLL